MKAGGSVLRCFGKAVTDEERDSREKAQEEKPCEELRRFEDESE
jgi:hypothetical protein